MNDSIPLVCYTKHKKIHREPKPTMDNISYSIFSAL